MNSSPAVGFSALIRARQLARPLGTAFTLEPDDDAWDSARRMRGHQFDSAPVVSEGVPVGVFETIAARRSDVVVTVGQSMRPLTAGLVVSSEMPLSALMRHMQDEPFLFVLDEGGMSGFITATDLGSVPVRTHFYLQLAHLESTLGAHLRAYFPDQAEAISLLGPKRRETQSKIAEDLRSKDRFIDDLSCVSLDDLITIAGDSQAFRRAFEGADVTMRAAKRGIADFRNDIMHPARTWPSTTKLVEREARIAALIHAAESLASAVADRGCPDGTASGSEPEAKG